MSTAVPTYAPRLRQYWATVYKRTWRGSIISFFLLPFLYLTAMGVGLGSFVDDNAGPEALDGVSYLAYLAPGLLATTAMQGGVGASSFPVLGGFKWSKTYFAMAASPLRVQDIVAAHLSYVAFRLSLVCTVFLGVLSAYGAVENWPGVIPALLTAVLVGLAHAAPMFAFSSRIHSESYFSLVFRLGVVPMMLFSGAFFPVSQLGDLAFIAYLMPVYHGVETIRMFTLGDVDWLAVLGHVSYLVCWLIAGWLLAVRNFRRRLAS
jgi:lipooligosaccharide transport system permease protein